MGGQTESKSSTTYPDWVNEAGEFLTAKGKDFANTDFTAYTGDRVADFSSDQSNAFQRLRDVIAGAPQVGPEALNMVRTAANAPAQAVSTERVVDEGGKLGSIASYTDPYMKAADGPVQAAIRKITEASDVQRKGIGAGATMAGAFGDARHGIKEAQLGRDTSLAIGETAGNLYGKAFSDAMASRTGDLNRFGQTDLANAGFNETALGRMAKGATDLTGTAQADQQRMLQQVAALLESGGQQQGQEQMGLDRAWEEFLREQYGDTTTKLGVLGSALGAGPKESTTTTQTPDTTGARLAGSAMGAILLAAMM
jgi:hypothetical protein